MAQTRAARRAWARAVAALTLGALVAPRPSVAQEATVLSLGDAARLAARQNGAVEIAAARVGQASARAQQRRGALFPELVAGVQQGARTLNTATFGFAFTDPTGRPLLDPNGELLGPVPTVDLRYRVTQPLVDLANVARWRSAQAATTAASAEADAQADAAAAQAALTYVRAARASAQVSARVADSALAADLLRIARDQLEAGVGVALDVTRAQTQLAAARSAAILARNERDRALLELKRVIGVALDAPLVLADSLGAMPLESRPDDRAALDRAEAQRADVRALEAQERAAQSAVRAIRWERAPQLGVVVDHGAIGKNWQHLLPTYTWGVQLSLGVFDGFRREARREEGLAAVRETDARLRDLRTQSALDVRLALLDFDGTRDAIETARERHTLAQQEVQQAQDRFRAGVSGNAEVILALLSLNQARTGLNDALAAHQTARVQFARATGSIRALR